MAQCNEVKYFLGRVNNRAIPAQSNTIVSNHVFSYRLRFSSFSACYIFRWHLGATIELVESLVIFSLAWMDFLCFQGMTWYWLPYRIWYDIDNIKIPQGHSTYRNPRLSLFQKKNTQMMDKVSGQKLIFVIRISRVVAVVLDFPYFPQIWLFQESSVEKCFPPLKSLQVLVFRVDCT